MKNNYLPAILFVILCLAASFSQNKEQKALPDDMGMIEKTIHSCIGWAKTKNIDLLYSVIANDTAFLEVHPNDEVVKSFTQFKEAEKIWMDPGFKAIRYEIRDLNIHISESGTVAWWYCVLDDINEWQGKPASWENTRWTGVCEKRDGRWVVVQQHFSFAQ